MVVAPLNDFSRYVGLHKQFAKVEEFLKTFEFEKPGEKIYIDGDKLFAIQAHDNAKLKENAFLEVHNRYIDIQVCLEGTEIMGYRSRSDCRNPKTEFNTEKDIMFYLDAPISYVTVPEGSFAIFFPEDGHAPLIGEGKIKKVIFKVEQ